MSHMNFMKIALAVLGEYQENCWMVSEDGSKTMAVIDPGDDVSSLEQAISEDGRTPEAILITHGHFDHLAAAGPIAGKYDIPIIFPAKELEYIRFRRYPFMMETGDVLDGFLKAFQEGKSQLVLPGSKVQAAGLTFKVIEVPGHTDHSVCYYCAKEKVLFGGDTLFAQSIGRTDLYQGGPGDLETNIRNKLMTLPKDIHVLTGHGPVTTIGIEAQYNPFVGNRS